MKFLIAYTQQEIVHLRMHERPLEDELQELVEG